MSGVRRSSKSNIAFIAVAGLLFLTLCGFVRPGVRSQPDAEASRAEYAGHRMITVYVDGILETFGYIIESETYMPLSVFFDALKLDYEVLAPEEGYSLLVRVGEIELRVPENAVYMVAGDRYFYLPNGLRVVDDEYCLPVVLMAKLVSAEVQWIEETECVDVDTTHFAFLQSAAEFYDETDLYWLSRIISAESGNQPVEGMMGVGNVVMNRVLEPSCPGTVKEVIFDTKYGIQFSPVETGSIYNEPNEQSVIAAKLCLEGYNVVGDSLYFVNPEMGITSWFRQTRTFITSIGDHDFYA